MFVVDCNHPTYATKNTYVDPMSGRVKAPAERPVQSNRPQRQTALQQHQQQQQQQEPERPMWLQGHQPHGSGGRPPHGSGDFADDDSDTEFGWAVQVEINIESA